MKTNDADIFQQAMEGVTPLKQVNNRMLLVKKAQPTLADIERRRQACAQPLTDANPLTIPDELALCDPHDIGGIRKNGIQEGVFRKLRLGQYEVQASLDLHRLTLKDARSEVHNFLEKSHSSGLRTLLIAHGKGSTAVMKSYTWHWLDQHPLVLAWHSAIARLGGAGATLVLIRKRHSPHKK